MSLIDRSDVMVDYYRANIRAMQRQEPAGCADCSRHPIEEDGLCARHSRQYSGAEPFEDDHPLVGDECDCVSCSSDLVGIVPCFVKEEN